MEVEHNGDEEDEEQEEEQEETDDETDDTNHPDGASGRIGRRLGHSPRITEVQEQAVQSILEVLESSPDTTLWADKRGKKHLERFFQDLISMQGVVVLAAKKGLLSSYRVARLVRDPQASD